MFLTAEALLTEYSLSTQEIDTVARWRKETVAILEAKHPKVLLIVGPCSIHNTASAMQYARRLKILAEEVSDIFYVIMRTYFEKPRTSSGWKGLLYDPHANGSYDIPHGLRTSRKLLRELIQLGMPTATEFLDPMFAPYISDCITWGSIGARTAESQIHRQLASNLAMPVGFKNRPDGAIDVAIHGALQAKQSQHFLGINNQGQTVLIKSSGNCCPHVVLRGGNKEINYDRASIERTKRLLVASDAAPIVIVDCSHGNSKKDYNHQTAVFSSLIEQLTKDPLFIRGLMLESFLLEGKQKEDSAIIHPDISLTDPCLGWEKTEMLIRQGHDQLCVPSCSF